MGRCRRFPVPVLAHAGQALQALLTGRSAEGTPQLTEGHDHHDAIYAGRKCRQW